MRFVLYMEMNAELFFSYTKYVGVTLQSDTRFDHVTDGTVTEAKTTLAFSGQYSCKK